MLLVIFNEKQDYLIICTFDISECNILDTITITVDSFERLACIISQSIGIKVEKYSTSYIEKTFAQSYFVLSNRNLLVLEEASSLSEVISNES